MPSFGLSRLVLPRQPPARHALHMDNGDNTTDPRQARLDQPETSRSPRLPRIRLVTFSQRE
jgi:hypothetical protein